MIKFVFWDNSPRMCTISHNQKVRKLFRLLNHRARWSFSTGIGLTTWLDQDKYETRMDYWNISFIFFLCTNRAKSFRLETLFRFLKLLVDFHKNSLETLYNLASCRILSILLFSTLSNLPLIPNMKTSNRLLSNRLYIHYTCIQVVLSLLSCRISRASNNSRFYIPTPSLAPPLEICMCVSHSLKLRNSLVVAVSAPRVMFWRVYN